MRLPGDIDLRMAWAVWMRNFTVYRRTWTINLLPNFFEPVLYLFGLGLGLGYYLEAGLEGRDYVAFIGPGLMAASAMNGASFEATYNMYIKMQFARLYDAYLGTPAQIQDIAFGELLWAVTRALIYGLAFLLILLAFTAAGYPALTAPSAALLPLALVLTAIVFGALGQVFTALVANINLFNFYFTLFLTPMFLFSGIFFPVERFPFGEEIAWMTPLYHAVRLCRGLAQGPLELYHLVSAAWLLVVGLLLLPLVPRMLRRRMVR